MQPLAFFQDPVGILAVEERAFVAIKNGETVTEIGRGQIAVHLLQQRARDFEQGPGVDIEPRRPLEDRLGADRAQALALPVLRRRRQQLAQTPNSRIHRATATFAVEVRPEQVDQPVPAMRAVGECKKKPGETAPGRTKIRPDPLVDTRYPTDAEQAYAQHGGPPPTTRSPGRRRPRRSPLNCSLARNQLESSALLINDEITRARCIGLTVFGSQATQRERGGCCNALLLRSARLDNSHVTPALSRAASMRRGKNKMGSSGQP